MYNWQQKQTHKQTAIGYTVFNSSDQKVFTFSCALPLHMSLSFHPHQQFISLLSKLLIYQCYDVTALQRSLQTGSCHKRPLHIYSFHLQIVLSTKVRFSYCSRADCTSDCMLPRCCSASLQRSDSSEWFCLNGGMKPTSNRDYSTPSGASRHRQACARSWQFTTPSTCPEPAEQQWPQGQVAPFASALLLWITRTILITKFVVQCMWCMHHLFVNATHQMYSC